MFEKLPAALKDLLWADLLCRMTGQNDGAGEGYGDG